MVSTQSTTDLCPTPKMSFISHVHSTCLLKSLLLTVSCWPLSSQLPTFLSLCQSCCNLSFLARSLLNGGPQHSLDFCSVSLSWERNCSCIHRYPICQLVQQLHSSVCTVCLYCLSVLSVCLFPLRCLSEWLTVIQV